MQSYHQVRHFIYKWFVIAAPSIDRCLFPEFLIFIEPVISQYLGCGKRFHILVPQPLFTNLQKQVNKISVHVTTKGVYQFRDTLEYSKTRQHYMRLAYSLGSLLTVNNVIECAKTLSNSRADTVWIPETWGMENFSMLATISQFTQSKIGSSIINIYSRSPALIAMGAATVDTISNGRLVLGLGASSVPIVQNFHGGKMEKPLKRMKEYLEIIRLVLSGSKVDYQGEIFNLKGFKLLIKPPRKNIPIYLAAVNQKMTELAWSNADGVIFYLRPLTELKKTIERMQSKRKIDVTCQIITSVSNDSETAIQRAKKTLAFYVSVGKIYRDFLAENGYRNETQNIYEEFRKTGLDMNHELVTERMLKDLTICGIPEECKKQLSRFKESGLDLPIIQFNPTGKVEESCKLFAETFSNE